MAVPTFDEAQVYKSRVVESEVRVAVELDYPVFASPFADEFPGAAIDEGKWFSFVPSWGAITVAGGTVKLEVTDADGGISPPWMQSRHNLAFPLSRDTDWYMITRARFPVVTGFGVWMSVCGKSFRDAGAIWALKADEAGGSPADVNQLRCHLPYAGYESPINDVVWSTAGAPSDWRQYRLDYDASAQTYTLRIDEDDDVADPTDPTDAGWEILVTRNVDGRYADAIVLGNSVAIQGQLGAWTSLEVDYIRVYGTTETVQDPTWAAPFTYDGTRFTYLPTVLSGRISVDKDNLVDAAQLELANFGLDEAGDEDPQLYTWMRFLNRRAIIDARAGDGSGLWLPWQFLFDGKCAEKQVRLDENGRCSLTVPMRDRYRATADDMEILAAYSDAANPIPGVGMNMTVAEIIADIYANQCGLAAAAYNVVATPNNTPRNYNVFRQSAQAAVKTIADHAVLAVYQRVSDGRIEIQEWDWGSDVPDYRMSTSEEVRFLEWTESAFDVTSAEQLSIENTNIGNGGFSNTWPPHREPFYGRLVHSNAVACQTSIEHDQRPITHLGWWARNRKLGSLYVTAHAQLWVDHNQELAVYDDRFLGFGRGETWIVDGWEHSWDGGGVIQTRIRLINPHPDRFLRANLMP